MLSRRTLLGTSAASLTAVALGACVPPPGVDNVNAQAPIPPADSPVTLTFWSWLKDLQNVCDIFNAQHERIQVETVWIPSGPGGGYAKMLSAVAAGGGPDIGLLEYRNVLEFALAGAVVDLGRYGAWDHERAYEPGAWSQVVAADEVYGIPMDTGPVALFYQTSLFEELGAQPPTSWEQWAEVARAVREHDPSHFMSSLDPGDGSVLPMYAMQAGAQWFGSGPDGWVVNMTDDVSRMVAEFWDQVLDEDLVSTMGSFSAPWYAAAGEGRIYSHMGASWSDALIQTVPGGEGKWRVAPMPRWEVGYDSGQQGGGSAAVMANSEHPAEALEFLSWLCGSPEGIDALIEHSGIGWSPLADYIGEARQQPSEFFGGQNYTEEVMVPMSEGQNLDWMWPPIWQRTFNILGDGMRARVEGGSRLVDFLPQAQAQIVEIMRDKGLTVREGT